MPKSVGQAAAGARQRRFLWYLGAIVAVGFVLRLVVAYELKANYAPVVRPAPTTDMHTYREYAQAILAGTYDYSKGFYYQPFYYAVFLPVVFKVFGPGSDGVIWVQALLAAASIWLVGLTFARLGGRLAGLVAAALLALARFHVFYTPFMLLAVLQGFWLVLLLYLCLGAWRRRRWWHWTWPGLVLGVAILTRGNMIILAPAVLGLLAWRHHRELPALGAAVVVFLAAMYAVQLPFSIVNYRAVHRWVGPSTAGPAVLALGNTPEAPPGARDPDAGAGPMEYPPSYAEWLRQDALTGPGRVSLAGNIWRWFRREPAAYLELKFRMVLVFWNKMEIPNNVSVLQWNAPAGQMQPVAAPVLHLPLLLDFFVLGCLGLTGTLLALAAWRRPPLFTAAVLVHLYALSIALFYIADRFRVPLVPLVCGFGGWAVARLWRQYRHYRAAPATAKPRDLQYSLPVLMACFVIVGFGFDLYRTGLEAHVLRRARPRGVPVELADRWTFQDNGPKSLGGWTPYAIGDDRLRKQFVVGQLPEGTPRLLQLFLSSEGRGQLRVELSKTARRLELPPGTGSVMLELGPSDCVPVADLPPGAPPTVEVAFRLTNESSTPLYYLVDVQRQYGRSLLPAEAPRGELVVRLEVMKETPKP